MNVLEFFANTLKYETIPTSASLVLNIDPSFHSQNDSPSRRDSHSDTEQGDDNQTDTQTLVKSKPKLKRPPLYKVILLNDDYTPMEFVILVLMKHFSKTPQQAEKIMLDVHNQGSGIAGIYPFEVAETKVFSVNEFSRRQKHPLKCIMEEDSSIEDDEM